jgi:hypothetical protein
VDSGVQYVRKAYTVKHEEGRRAGLMATKSWRLVQEDFDVDFSDDDGDLECDEGTRVQANIRT